MEDPTTPRLPIDPEELAARLNRELTRFLEWYGLSLRDPDANDHAEEALRILLEYVRDSAPRVPTDVAYAEHGLFGLNRDCYERYLALGGQPDACNSLQWVSRYCGQTPRDDPRLIQAIQQMRLEHKPIEGEPGSIIKIVRINTNRFIIVDGLNGEQVLPIKNPQ